MVKYSQKGLDQGFGALANPIRREIVGLLALSSETSIGDLHSRFSISLPGIWKHVNVLADAGLIDLSKRGRVRYCRLNAAAADRLFEWLGRYRRFWMDRLDDLESVLEQAKENSKRG